METLFQPKQPRRQKATGFSDPVENLFQNPRFFDSFLGVEKPWTVDKSVENVDNRAVFIRWETVILGDYVYR